MKKRILVIEDEVRISRVISLELMHEGYEVETIENGKDGLSRAKEEKWDLILLDVMLPGMSGFEVLRRLRMEDENTPVILLTARDSVFDKVNGLDHGANDYITKPFEMEELLARMRSAIRVSTTRNSQSSATALKSIDDLEIDEGARTVKRAGTPIELTRREFDLLVFLLDNRNQVLSRDQLLNKVWGFDYVGETNVVDVYIGYLRKKIDHDYDYPLIHTIRGVGFMLKGQNT
ncbi:response regulator transcription factor [Robertmurraya andreesenii]|uniref:DNA-binding response OmpR family regulator n=1 Tax=Anoxybacillus andreesenii TaxID=1325932 RepID=A0ABT9V8P5_9BACL|nr:response regulator transcription factor [Robertmurraya andreesenii]MDQ0157310.1 DNA-binding response OmpR family regulator [Robertmurraya andreesenii]